MLLWQQNFSASGIIHIPIKIPIKKRFKIDVFSLLRRDPVFELQIVAFCGACVRSSIAFCNSLFADRSGVAASRLLVVAAACVILLCFAAANCKSHCNGGVRVANAALAAKFF